MSLHTVKYFLASLHHKPFYSNVDFLDENRSRRVQGHLKKYRDIGFNSTITPIVKNA